MFREQKRYGNDPNVVIRSKTFIDPLMWKEPSMVFACSWSDWFIEEADEWRPEVWEIIRRTPHLTYQILTKRPENIRSRLPKDWGEGWDNVWLGVSIESWQSTGRGWLLSHIPSKVRFISAEPLIGVLNLSWLLAIEKFHWVIVGGESGSGCRPMDLNWVRDIYGDCKHHGVPFFMKQLGGHPNRREDIDKFPEDLRIQEFPKMEENNA